MGIPVADGRLQSCGRKLTKRGQVTRAAVISVFLEV
jgi:hypothetical protein